MEAYEKLAKILRTDKDVVKLVEEKMVEIVGHNKVLDKIVEENDRKKALALNLLNVSSFRAHDIFRALLAKIKEDDEKLAKFLFKNSKMGREEFGNMLAVAKRESGVSKGRFLKIEKAKELVTANPPPEIIKFLGYKGAEELLDKEDIFEIFAALRFMEERDWLNGVFFKPYEKLSPDDFEEREIKTKVLSDKWIRAAEKFIKKKYHNLSHLKELGFIFVIPIQIERPGETMRNFTLSLHYLHEVKFYSDLFERYARGSGEEFAEKFISGLRGDVIDERPPEEKFGEQWLIVQRYLAKDDEYDWRLFYPHVNPEALHWERAERDLARISEKYALGLEFWNGLGFAGDFYKDESGVEVLVSFNLIDNAMALFMDKELIKYLYHHQEALWNKIFTGFLGEEKMEEMIIENFDKGIIKLSNE